MTFLSFLIIGSYIGIINVSLYSERNQPGGVANSTEDAQIAVHNDKQRDKEDTDKEQHGVGTDRWSKRHIVPRAGGHQTLRNICT